LYHTHVSPPLPTTPHQHNTKHNKHTSTPNTHTNHKKKSTTDVFDTVVYAIGRTADTAALNLEAAGLMANAKCVS
jgi:pyruvate/2-oxoglutarate dehydrogenase complex dihydrolipoamide dehydrogenase (E3) component